MTFEPKIVGILCNWCSYTGADLAGTSRIKYAPNVRVLRVMCSGRVDPTFVLKAFADGADGVLVAGCHPGDCHYIEGNYKTVRRIAFLKRMLKDYGIEPERFRLEWVSAGEGDRWAEVVNQITEDVRKLGPTKIKPRGKKRPTISAAETGFEVRAHCSGEQAGGSDRAGNR
jgi:F420-non-reducing hydrogenase iron-sulfur subunit